MKLLLILLHLFLVAASTVATAQDKPDVLIPLPVATFFLEQNEHVKIMQRQIDSLSADISVLEQRQDIATKRLVIEQQKQIVYDSLVTAVKAEQEVCYKAAADLSKKLETQKKTTKRVGIAGAILIALALFL